MIEDNKIIVSIQCLAYNHEKYIRQCLEGFVMQKTNFKYEAIVHDDASTDGTAAIIREYADKYPDIIKPIFETENQYSKRDGSLRRIMNAEMHGKYIAMCEGDDYWVDPLKLQKQVDILEADNSLIAVCTNSSIVDNNGCTISQTHDRIVKDNIEGRYNLRDYIHNVHSYPTATVVYRNMFRGRISEMQEKTSNPFFGDWNLWIILHTFGDFYFLNQVTSAYRINPTSVTHSNIDKRRLGLAKANFSIIKSIQSILPEDYSDIKKELDNTAWAWYSLANAYKHSHQYFSMIYALLRCELKDPAYIINIFMNKLK